VRDACEEMRIVAEEIDNKCESDFSYTVAMMAGGFAMLGKRLDKILELLELDQVRKTRFEMKRDQNSPN
jgi:hypoxanthine-guanine phosphoribosyltransferase